MRQRKSADKMAITFDADYSYRVQTDRSPRKQRVFRIRTNPLDAYGEHDFFLIRLRMRKAQILTLHEAPRSKLEYPQTRKGVLPALLQLIIAKRIYACGYVLGVLGDMHSVSIAICNRLENSTPGHMYF